MQGVFHSNGNYYYQDTTQPDGSGMARYAFLRPTTLPLMPLQGPGTPYGYKWNPLQPPQVFHPLQQTMQGQIGIVAGQMALQPLIDNRDMMAGVNG